MSVFSAKFLDLMVSNLKYLIMQLPPNVGMMIWGCLNFSEKGYIIQTYLIGIVCVRDLHDIRSSSHIYEVLCSIRNTITSELGEEYINIAREKADRLFYKIFPSMSVKTLPKPLFSSWEIKVLYRLTANHTYHKSYLKMIRALDSDLSDLCLIPKSAEHLIFNCKRWNIIRLNFSLFVSTTT